MQNRTYDGLRDYLREFILIEEVKAWLNEAQEDLANRLKITTKYVAGTVTAGGTVPLPADLIEVRALRLGTDNTALEFPDDDVFFNAVENAGAPQPNTLARITAGVIEILPVPADTTTYRMRYVYRPVDMTADADISPLPIELHIRMVQYARSHGKLREGEQAQAESYMAMYERGLPPPPLGQFRVNPGPVSVGYQPGPFDTAESIHRG